MEVTCELTPDDLWHYNLYYRNHRAAIRPTFLYILAAILSVVFVGGVWVVADSWLKSGQPDWTLLFCLAMMVYFTRRFLPATKKRLVKRYSQQPGLFGEHIFGISSEWFSEKTSVNDTKIAWATVHSIEEDQTYIYLFLSKTHAHIIPKRAFSSLAEARAFLDKSRRYWDAAKTGTSVATDDAAVWPPAPRSGA